MRRSILVAGAAAVAALGATGAVAATALAGTRPGYEAEAASNILSGSARIDRCEPCSGETRVGWVGYSGRLTFRGVRADAAGPVTVRVTYSSAEQRYARLRVNDGRTMRLRFPATGSPDTTGTLTLRLTLRAGENTLTFGNPYGWAPDFDRLDVGGGGGATPTETVPEPPTSAPTTAPTTTPPATAPTTAPTTAAPTTTPPRTTPPTTAPTTAPTSTAPTSRPPTSTPPVGPGPFAADEAEVVKLVNAERAAAGCGPMTVDSRLTQAARLHSQDMAAKGYFSHTSQDAARTEFGARITRAGYRFGRAAENIAKGQRTPADVMRSWMGSTGHRANILNCDLRHIGVGVAADASGTRIWTQDFASPLY